MHLLRRCVRRASCLRLVSRFGARTSSVCSFYRLKRSRLIIFNPLPLSVIRNPCIRFSHVIVALLVDIPYAFHARSDVDECLERNMCPGECQNTIGSYICIMGKSVKDAPYEACPPGYQWESRTSTCAGNIKTIRYRDIED